MPADTRSSSSAHIFHVDKPGAESGPRPVCYKHASTCAETTCFACLRAICGACTVFDGGNAVCPACAAASRRASRRKRIAGVVAAASAIGGVVAFLTLHKGPLHYGEQQATVDKAEAALGREPCDKVNIVRLTEAMSEAGDHVGALERAADFFTRCGEHRRLLWVTYSAHLELAQYDAAISDATQLIAAVPEDQDYRWWRGRAHNLKGNHEQAYQDYLQTILLLPQVDNIPFTVVELANSLGRPCDGILPLQQFLRHHRGSNIRDRLGERIDALFARAECQGMEGQGEVEVVVRGKTLSRGDVVVMASLDGGPLGRFLVDRRVDLVVVSEGFARRSSLDLDKAQPVTLKTPREFINGRLARVRKLSVGESGGAWALEVDVVVRAQLPDHVDGILGANYLDRFEIIDGKDTLTIAGRNLR